MTQFDLDGTVAVVTGGSRGVGPQIAAALARRGARIALVARSQPELAAVAETLREKGSQVLAIGRISLRPPTGAASSKPPNRCSAQ
jgi:gluconate 5-dehydrogenase